MRYEAFLFFFEQITLKNIKIQYKAYKWLKIEAHRV